MKKLFLAAILASGILHVSAQTKIAYVNTQELMGIMPESQQVEDQLKTYQATLTQQGEDMAKEADDKAVQFVKDSASFNESMKEIKRNEILDLYRKSQNWGQTMKGMLNQKAEELSAPVRTKVFDTIKAVATENGYGYVFDTASNALLIMPPGDDLLPLIKKKLGIK